MGTAHSRPANIEQYTAKVTAISPNFLVWKFCRKEQFSYSFGRFARSYAETVPFHKIATPGNQVKLRYFQQWSFINQNINKNYFLRLHISENCIHFDAKKCPRYTKLSISVSNFECHHDILNSNLKTQTQNQNFTEFDEN